MKKNKNQKVEKVMSEIELKIASLISAEAQTFQDYQTFGDLQIEFPSVYQRLEKEVKVLERQGITAENVKEIFPATVEQKLKVLATVIAEKYLVTTETVKSMLRVTKHIGIKYTELKALGFDGTGFKEDKLARQFSTQLLAGKRKELGNTVKVTLSVTQVEMVRNTLCSFSVQIGITPEVLKDTNTLLLYLTELDKIDTQYKGGFVKIQVEMGVE